MSSTLFGAPEREESRSHRIRRLVEEVRQRRLRGELVTNESLTHEHPDLMPELAQALEHLSLLEAARANAKEHGVNVQRIGANAPGSTHRSLSVRCPHCRSSLQIHADSELAGIECDSCRQHFSLAADDDLRSPESNCTLGHLVLLERLGSGSFGVVWKARDTELDRIVAVKIPRQSLHAVSENEKFLHEARTVAQLNHPNIVRLYEVGRDGDTIFIVTDLVEGMTLADWLLKRPPSFRQATSMCETIADALQYAHDNGVIHRDLKPTNVLVDHQNAPHLLDFGLARRDMCQTTVTVDGQVLGTPAYMSPEQAKGQSHQADHRSDIYSLGVVLFEMLTGERPFRGSPHLLAQQVVSNEPPQLRKLNSSVPRDLETICLKCLEKDADRRYQTAQLLADDLGRFLRHEPVHARPLPLTTRALRLCRRNPLLASLVATLMVVVVVGLSSVTALWLMAAKEVRSNQWSLYRADMRAARSAWDAGNVDRCLEYLIRHRESDWRGFEWRHLWHLCHRNSPRLQFRSGGLAQICYSPDGLTLAITPRDKLSLWDPSTGKRLYNESAHGEAIPGLAVAPDGSTVATCSLDGSVRIWRRMPHGELSFDRELLPATNSARAMCVAFSRSGDMLAAAIGNRIKLWYTDEYRPAADLTGHSGEVRFLAFSPAEESLLASAGRDKTVRLWNTTNRGEIATPLEHEGAVWAVAFSPDGKLLASAGDGETIRLWNVETLAPERELPGHTGRIQSLAFLPDGTWIASGSWDRTVRIWDLTSSSNRSQVLRGFDGLTTVAFSPDGNTLATNSMYGTAKLYDFPVRDETNTLAGQYVALSKDTTELLTVGRNRTARLFNFSRGFVEAPFEISTSLGRSWSFSADLSRFAKLSERGGVEVWDVKSNQPLRLVIERTGTVESVLLSPNGQALAVAGGSQVDIWDLSTLTVSAAQLKVFREPHGAYAMGFSPDSQHFIASRELKPVNEYCLQLWDLRGKPIARSKSHAYPFLDIAFSDDGRVIASGSYNQITLWNLDNDEHARLIGTYPSGERHLGARGNLGH